jgi:hypothetical protein
LQKDETFCQNKIQLVFLLLVWTDYTKFKLRIGKKEENNFKKEEKGNLV